MRSALTWAAFVVFALCLVGMVAWPLWSDNDLWSFFFAAVGSAVLFPVILWRAVGSVLSAFSSSSPSDDR
jgi:hypothetical protein